ncbi:MAG TPA: MoaD/ThiS family protein [Egibacteraceae bacterium]|nr:MoaD/ThiS family protein [Egibacteraceae bacterium]
MSIQVRVPTVLRKHTDGEKVVQAQGATLREVIDDLGQRNADLTAALVDESGALRRFVNVYVNDEDVRYLGGIETPVSDGDTVSILPAVAGG